RGTEVSTGNIDDAVRNLHGVQHVPLPTQETLMLGVGVFRSAVCEHFDLVELVDADDAAGVLAVAARFTAEARGPTGVALRAFVQLENFTRVVTGHRNLGGADEVEVVF